MGLKLLLKMLGFVGLVLLIGIALASLGVSSAQASYVGLLIPLGLFAFIIYKFKKEGVVAILYFLGGLFILSSILSGYSGIVLYVLLIIGVVMSGLAYLLAKIWEVKLFKKKEVKENL